MYGYSYLIQIYSKILIIHFVISLLYLFFLERNRYSQRQRFLIDSAPAIPLSHHWHSLPVRFSMQRYSVRSVAKYRYANGIWILQQPSTNHRFGYSVKSVCCFLVLSVLSPLPVLHKNQPLQEAEEPQSKGNKFNKSKFKVMHSRIFQISTTRVEEDNYLNENTLLQGDGIFYDYCAEIDNEERKQDIADLVEYALPKGMFELTSDDTIRYKGSGEKWKEEFVANIRKKAEVITTENMLEWGPVYYLKQALNNPLNTDYHFYLDGEGCQSYAEQSFAFMKFVSTLEPGTTLYIGGVIDYHF